MQRTTLKEFQEELRATGGYETPAARLAPKRRASSAFATARFSFSVSRVFPLCALYQPLGLLTIDRWASFCFSSVTMSERYGIPVHVEGWQQRAAHKGPVVFVCNHMSTLETVLLPPIILAFGPFKVVTKASLAHLPFLETAARRMGVVPIGRKDPRADLLTLFDAGKKFIGEGSSFLIFSQGTRQKVFARNHFSSIGAKLAEKTGVPLVPIAVDTRCMPTRSGTGFFDRALKDFGTVDTSFDVRCACGPVIPCGKSRAMHEQSFDWIATKLESWGCPVDRTVKGEKSTDSKPQVSNADLSTHNS